MDINNYYKLIRTNNLNKCLTEHTVSFFSPKNKYYEFSNFWSKRPTIIDNISYISTENYFQSQKFIYDDASDITLEYGKLIASDKIRFDGNEYNNTPGKSKLLGTQRVVNRYLWQKQLTPIIEYYKDAQIDPNWEDRKLKVMYKAVYNKFNNDPKLKNILLETNGKIIVENSPFDKCWGIGKHGDGENLLGLTLMAVREKLIFETHM